MGGKDNLRKRWTIAEDFEFDDEVNGSMLFKHR
jgi:hypothetical protein